MATTIEAARNIFEQMPAEPVHAVFFTESGFPPPEVPEALRYLMDRGAIRDYVCVCSRAGSPWHFVYRKEMTDAFAEIARGD